MPNGKPGDSPYTDFFVHGYRVFPDDMCEMLTAIYEFDHRLLTEWVDGDMWDWQEGRNLEQGRDKLRDIIEKNKIPFHSD